MSSRENCIIIAAMEISDKDSQKIKSISNPYIICADAGYHNALKYSISPDILLGDFDSFGGDLSKVEVNTLSFPVEKDDTDTMLAIKEGISHGCESFFIFGAIGGRIDHTFANITGLKHLVDNNCRGWIMSDANCITMIQNSEITIESNKNYKYISVFSYSDYSTGVCIDNCKYPLDDYRLENRFPLGVSNHIIGKECKITVENGTLLIVLSA